MQWSHKTQVDYLDVEITPFQTYALFGSSPQHIVFYFAGESLFGNKRGVLGFFTQMQPKQREML